MPNPKAGLLVAAPNPVELVEVPKLNAGADVVAVPNPKEEVCVVVAVPKLKAGADVVAVVDPKPKAGADVAGLAGLPKPKPVEAPNPMCQSTFVEGENELNMRCGIFPVNIPVLPVPNAGLLLAVEPNITAVE